MVMAQVEAVDWVRAQDALRHEVARVTALLRSVRNPRARAVGGWDLTDVAMHLSQAWIIVPAMARGDAHTIAEIVPTMDTEAGGSPLRDVWDLAATTWRGVQSDPERDPSVLADRIEARAADYFAACAAASPLESRPWLVDGVTVPPPTFTCHLLNETIVHGHDIARADGRRWPIDRAHAAIVLEGFVFPIISALGPRAMLDQQRAAGVRATYDVRLRGAGRHIFAFDDGALAIRAPGSDKVDCHISADPASLLLVAWARKSQWVAIATGRLMAWGRKPWLGPRLRMLMRNP